MKTSEIKSDLNYFKMKSISKVTIPKKITNGEELIVVRTEEYEYLPKHLTEIQDAFAKICKGDQEF